MPIFIYRIFLTKEHKDIYFLSFALVFIIYLTEGHGDAPRRGNEPIAQGKVSKAKPAPWVWKIPRTVRPWRGQKPFPIVFCFCSFRAHTMRNIPPRVTLPLVALPWAMCFCPVGACLSPPTKNPSKHAGHSKGIITNSSF